MTGDRDMLTTEPAAGRVIRGPYADGTFRVFTRDEDGSQHFLGQADDYESARAIATEEQA